MTTPRTVEHVVCLGCGCACDDIAVTVRDGRIVETARACPRGREWFGDGTVPAAVLMRGRQAVVRGREQPPPSEAAVAEAAVAEAAARPLAEAAAATDVETAVAEAAEVLAGAAGRVLVYLAPDLTCEAQRAAIALADRLGAMVDGATSDTAATGLLAAQRRGRTTATLGEIRNRADLLLFWAVDPAVRYPRYLSRYALDPVGTHVPQGRAGRTVIAVSVGADRGPAEAEVELMLDPAEEIAALSVMRATVLGNPLSALPPRLQAAAHLANRLTQARYVAVVHDAEPPTERRDPFRTEGLIALTEALNGPTRAALSSLRAGGNRSGAEAVLTWQSGYPFAVDYSRGYPSYMPEIRGLERLVAGSFAAVLVVGSVATVVAASAARLTTGPAAGSAVATGAEPAAGWAGGVPAEVTAALGRAPTILVGPRASEAPFATAVAIDTGVAGIHEGGVAYRMDDVPLPLRPPLPTPRSTEATLVAIAAAVETRLERSPA